MRFWSKLSVVQKIGFGFATLVSICLLIMALNQLMLNYATSRFTVYEQANLEAHIVQEIEFDIINLQRQVLAFQVSNKIRDVDALRGTLSKLRDHIAAVEDLTWLNDPSGGNISKNIHASVAVIAENIDGLEKQQNVWNQLEGDYISLFSSAYDQVSKLNADLGSDILGTMAMRLQVEIASAQASAIRYFSNKQYNLSSSVNTHLGTAEHVLENIAETNFRNEFLQHIVNSLHDTLDGIHRTFNKAIQADRNLVFLMNVVIAGELSELQTLAAAIHNLATDYQNSILEANQKELVTTKSTLWVSSVLLAMLALSTSILIVKSVVKPIREITNTLTRLGMGEAVEDIPGTDRNDEIGLLARAANIFRETSENKTRLLEETKILADSLREREAALRKSNDELDNFAYVASHDLKSPLRAIYNLSEWIEEDCYDILPDTSKQHLDLLKSRITRMENLLTNILRYSRVDKIDLEIVHLSSLEVMKDAIKLLDVPEHFSFTLPDNPPFLTAHAAPLLQVFQNLFSNSINYNDKKEGAVRVSSVEREDGFVEFSVCDNGIGIPKEYHDRVFLMFHALHSRDEIESSGMGLAIIKKVIENEGGSIHIDSSGGQGVCFIFTWPKSVQ